MTNDPELPDRDPGYYWVNWSGEPEPAMWDGARWYFIGADGETPDSPIVLSEEPIVFAGRPETVARPEPSTSHAADPQHPEMRSVGPEDEDRAGPEALED